MLEYYLTSAENPQLTIKGNKSTNSIDYGKKETVKNKSNKN
jgi:hypothetical protein